MEKTETEKAVKAKEFGRLTHRGERVVVTCSVELRAFARHESMIKVRPVAIDIQEFLEAESLEEQLELIFMYGQNDIQPVYGAYSVSCGDVIVVGERKFKVIGAGFKEVDSDYSKIGAFDFLTEK